MKKQRYLSSGRTTLEMIAVIAILGTVAVGVYNMASNVISQRRNIDALHKIHNLATTIQDAFSWSGNYVVVQDANTVYGTRYANIQEYLLGEDILSGNDLILPSGYTVTLGSVAAIAATSSAAGTPSYFTITFTPDKDLCNAVALEDWSDRLVSLKIGSTTYSGDSRPPLEVGTALAECKVTPSPTLVLTFR